MFIPLAYQIWKILKAISNQRVSSKDRVVPESIKSNDKDNLNWLSVVWNVTTSFYSVSNNLHAPTWMAFRKEAVTF